MTDKQIIIDVTQCPYHKEDKTCTYLPYKSKCEGDCNWTSYKEMEEQLKRKEQECEELKKIIDEAKNSKLDLKSFLVGEAVQNEYEQQLDQLKAENEVLKQYKVSKQASYEEMQRRWNEVEQENRQLKRQRQADKGLITSTGKMSKLKCFIQYVYIHFIQTFIHNELRYVVDADEYEQFMEWRNKKDG